MTIKCAVNNKPCDGECRESNLDRVPGRRCPSAIVEQGQKRKKRKKKADAIFGEFLNVPPIGSDYHGR